MTAHAVPPRRTRRRGRAGGVFTLPFIAVMLAFAAAAAFISDVLWPSWPSRPMPFDVPALPINVAGVLFDVPPAVIREEVQRHAGQQERLDLFFEWPSLDPPRPAGKAADKTPLTAENAVAAATATENKRLFVTIAGRGAELPPLDRLKTIYPRYVEAQASAGPDGLAILPFRKGTPYDGEDLVYVGAEPEQFFALCTRPGRAVPGTCIHERALETAEIAFRFPRDWFGDWRTIAAGFDRLIAQLHAQLK